MMVFPTARLARQYGVGRLDLRRARRSPAGRRLVRDALARPRRLCQELGLVPGTGELLWRALGIWDDLGAEAVADASRRPTPEAHRVP